jgi:hypothetical protein
MTPRSEIIHWGLILIRELDERQGLGKPIKEQLSDGSDPLGHLSLNLSRCIFFRSTGEHDRGEVVV